MSTRISPAAEASPAYLVALGASAGGLEALSDFFQHATASNACFVVNQHLSPDHKSALADLLGRRAQLAVSAITDGEPLRPGHIHLIPPGARLTVDAEYLHLVPRTSGDGVNFPIDDFFRSVAQHWGARGIAVVLSGTGSDGAAGMQTVVQAGGSVMVQSPESAGFDGMPRSALDAVPEALRDIPEQLANAVDAQVTADADPPKPKPTPETKTTGIAPDADDDTLLQQVLTLLKDRQHGDFSGYKTDALLNQIHNRCEVLHFSDPSDYVHHLTNSANEQDYLARQLMIPLTRFFRDPDAFRQLEKLVIDPMVKQWPNGTTMRVWCAGVASGEEAYTVSILLRNAFERHQKWPTLKLFATDRDNGQLPLASAGVYSDAIREEVPEEDLARWFSPVAEGYRVRKEIRQPVIFARHDVVEDPPFTGMDLILCRNVLIYLRPDSQHKALERLQYALNPNGVLQLGLTESPDTQAGAFTALDAECALYRLNRSVTPRRPRPRTDPVVRRSKPAKESLDARAVEALQRQLHTAYLPPTLIINQRDELVHVLGQVQPLLNFTGGDVSFHLERLLHPLVRSKVAQLVTDARTCLARGEPAAESAVTDGPGEVLYRVEVSSYCPEAGGEHYLALSFASVAHANALPDTTAEGLPASAAASENERGNSPRSQETASTLKDQRIDELERALDEGEANRRATVEELEASNEELHATNEELFTANEELQSTNEELQSLNEELHGVNVEHQENIKQMRQMQQDMDNLSQSLGIATLYLDQRLNIQRYTDAMCQFLPLRRGDEGRRLSEFSHRGLYEGLMADVEHCLATNEIIEFSLSHSETSDAWVRIMPYRIRNKAESGVVITVASMSLIRALAQQRPFMNALQGQLLILDNDGVLLMANDPSSQWSSEADFRLRTTLQLGEASLRDVETELNCRQRWLEAKASGDALAEKLIELTPAGTASGIGTAEVPLGRDGEVLAIHASPVVRGRQRHWLLTLREVGACGAST